MLGAGASWPQVPTLGSMPGAISRYLPYVTGYSPSPRPQDPIRQLLRPIPSDLLHTSWERAALQHLTGDAIAIALHQTITDAHLRRLPQYEVFRYVPLTTRIVSFNWDGLARALCPQSWVRHPHGFTRPIKLTEAELRQEIDAAQFFDDSDGKSILGPSFVMMGEEDSHMTASARAEVGAAWANATSITIIGYSFGLNSDSGYDDVWRDLFADVLGRTIPVHIVDPNGRELRAHISAMLKRDLDVFDWPYSWFELSRVLLVTGARIGAQSMLDLLSVERSIRTDDQRVRASSA